MLPFTETENDNLYIQIFVIFAKDPLEWMKWKTTVIYSIDQSWLNIFGRGNFLRKSSLWCKRKWRHFSSFKNFGFIPFLPSLLDKLSQSLTLTDDKGKEHKRFFLQQEQFDLIRKKEVFIYSYIDYIDHLPETSLPKRKEFFSRQNLGKYFEIWRSLTNRYFRKLTRLT